MTENKVIVELTNLIYNSEILVHKVVETKDQTFLCIDSINETSSLHNGLQAAAYQKVGEKDTLYLIVRGADVGLGRRIFHWLGADDRFIPMSSPDNEWLSSYQDWFYTSLLGGMGLVHLYQYDSLHYFYQNLKKHYPSANIVVAGHSLGGLLAQRLYLLERDISQCTTFAALSPWWTLPKEKRREIKKRDFYKQDPHLINYYSSYDIFRVFPFFRRNIGQQKNVLLQPFQSRTNLLATLLERVYWAHVPNYYIFDKSGSIRVVEEESILERWYRRLNQPAPYHLKLNKLIFVLSLFMGCLGVFLYLLGVESGFISERFVVHPDGPVAAVLFFFLVLFYFLPTIAISSRWKFLIFLLNLAFGWLVWPWFLLLLFIPIARDIQDLEADQFAKKKTNLEKNPNDR